MGAHLFCFGLGFSALTLAERLAARGWQVSGTCRSAEKSAAMTARGFRAHRFDQTRNLDAAGLADLAAATHLLISVPPEAIDDPVLVAHGPAIAAHRPWDWIGYLSTTGVYGDRQGGWVDETSALTPTGARGRRRVAAERAWLELGSAAGHPVQLFRLAGIYGPGRSALDTVRDGRAQRIDKPGQVFSRIHVADIAATLEASIAHPNAGRAYNLCDDDPAAPAEVIEFACRLLGVAPPPLEPFETATLSAMARSFYDDNKRVSNARIKAELGVALAFPSYKIGLPALLAAGY